MILYFAPRVGACLVFSAISKLERDVIRQRQREGIEIARQAGKYGRPKIEFTKEFKETHKKLKDGQLTAVQAMKLLGLRKTAFYQRRKEFEE